jgi:hypothetical protein
MKPRNMRRTKKSSVTTLNDVVERASFKGQASHFSVADATQCVHTIACSPLETKTKAGNPVSLFPDWATQSALYKQYRVAYFSASIVFDSNKSLANSTIEVDATEITNLDAMMKSPNFKAVSLDGDNKKIFRAYKASSAVERAWLDVAGTTKAQSHAHIKLLQDELPLAVAGLDSTSGATQAERRQKCEVQCSCVVEFRGRINPN